MLVLPSSDIKIYKCHLVSRKIPILKLKQSRESIVFFTVKNPYNQQPCCQMTASHYLALCQACPEMDWTDLLNSIIGFFYCRLRRYCYYRLSTTCYRIMGRAFSVVISYHNRYVCALLKNIQLGAIIMWSNISRQGKYIQALSFSGFHWSCSIVSLYILPCRENRAKGGGICVANHTSPIDIIILGCDNTYAMVSAADVESFLESWSRFINSVFNGISWLQSLRCLLFIRP